MTSSMDIWFNGNKELIWEKFCGYLHFSLPAFMHIQETLLIEQIKLLQGCELGIKLLGNQRINSIEDFRQKVPLTTYADYEPYLSKKREDVLPAKPRTWALTTLVGDQQKWVPISEKAWDVLVDSILGLLIISTSSEEAKFSLKPGDVVFNISPPCPFFAGICTRQVLPLTGLRLIPPDNDEFNRLSFSERISRGFGMAVGSRIDIIVAIGSMIVGAGQSFRMPAIPRKNLLDPKVTMNIIQALLRNKCNKNGILPMHFWKLKSILATGSDLPVFSPKIEYYWGKRPFEFYINTEYTCFVGSFTWNKKSMTFSPYACFLEFLPQKDINKISNNPGYRPKIILLNEIKAGQFYELVFTNLNGGIFTRYRSGDIVQFLSLDDKDAEIKLPQFAVKGRDDKLINIGNLTLIDEKAIWQILQSSAISYSNWMARKETERGEPVMRIYLESTSNENELDLTALLHEELKKVDTSYKYLEEMSGLKPLRVRLLPTGTLSRWENEMLKAGRDFNWVKEQRMQASDEVIDGVLKLVKEQA